MDSPEPGLPGGFCKIRVLLVEDEAIDAALAEANLHRSALDVEPRCVGSEAELRRGIREFDPHLLVSDFTLNGFDGYAALAVTRELAPSLPFIFLSGNACVEGSLGRGATDFVRVAQRWSGIAAGYVPNSGMVGHRRCIGACAAVLFQRRPAARGQPPHHAGDAVRRRRCRSTVPRSAC